MKFIIASAILNNVAYTKNIDVMTFEALLQNNSCNRDCVGYCLNYFPHHSILSQCGCMDSHGANEKFLINKNAKTVYRSNNLVDPIIE